MRYIKDGMFVDSEGNNRTVNGTDVTEENPGSSVLKLFHECLKISNPTIVGELSIEDTGRLVDLRVRLKGDIEYVKGEYFQLEDQDFKLIKRIVLKILPKHNFLWDIAKDVANIFDGALDDGAFKKVKAPATKAA